MPRFIEKPGAWIVRALGLRPGQASETLADEVVPTVDVIQGGIGNGVASISQVTTALAAGSQSYSLLAPDENKTRLVQISIERVGPLTARTVTAQIRGPLNTAVQLMLFYDVAHTLSFTPWKLAGEGCQWWIVPPGFDFRGFHSALGAGEGVVWTTVAYEVAAGCKPW